MAHPWACPPRILERFSSPGGGVRQHHGAMVSMAPGRGPPQSNSPQIQSACSQIPESVLGGVTRSLLEQHWRQRCHWNRRVSWAGPWSAGGCAVLAGPGPLTPPRSQKPGCGGFAWDTPWYLSVANKIKIIVTCNLCCGEVQWVTNHKDNEMSGAGALVPAERKVGLGRGGRSHLFAMATSEERAPLSVCRDQWEISNNPVH